MITTCSILLVPIDITGCTQALHCACMYTRSIVKDIAVDTLHLSSKGYEIHITFTIKSRLFENGAGFGQLNKKSRFERRGSRRGGAPTSVIKDLPCQNYRSEMVVCNNTIVDRTIRLISVHFLQTRPIQELSNHMKRVNRHLAQK